MTTSDDGSVVEPTDTQPEAGNKEPEKKGTPAPEVDPEESRKAAKAGESRKRQARVLLDLAKSSSEARQTLEDLVSDEYERTYFERKFGDEFTNLLAPAKEAPAKAEPVKDERYEKMFNDYKASRDNKLRTVQKNLGLTLDDADDFEDLVNTFEGKMIGGKRQSFQDAVELAAKTLKPNAPDYNTLVRGNVAERPEDKADDVDVPMTDGRAKLYSRHTGAKSAEDYKEIAQSLNKTGVFTPSY